jgi:hypothetical protein
MRPRGMLSVVEAVVAGSGCAVSRTWTWSRTDLALPPIAEPRDVVRARTGDRDVAECGHSVGVVVLE